MITVDNMLARSILMVTCFILFNHSAFGQTKNEKETRIKLSSFPELAQEVIKNLPEKCRRLKYFLETDGSKRSFELKFKFNKKRYSLEFSEEGKIEDIEVVAQLRAINPLTKGKIESHLSQTYLKHKFIKIQKQFVYTTDFDRLNFVNNLLQNETNVLPNYEIIAEVKSNKGKDTREFTFNNKGEFLKYRILKPSSYEHVLY